MASPKRKWVWSLPLIAVLGLLVWTQRKGTTVHTAIVEHKDLQRTIVASGRILSPAQVRIGSLLSGTVSVIAAREGQRVRAGELLLQLDDSVAKSQESQARARLSDARTGLRSVSAFDVPQATQQLEQARTRLEQRKKDAERAIDLVARQALPPNEAEAAQTELRLAQSQVQAAELQLAAVSRGGTASQRAAAAIASAEAELERARVELEHTQIRAPADGVVLERLVEPGDVVSAGAALFQLSVDGATRVVIEPDERSLAELRMNQPAKVSTEAFPAQTFDATVTYIAPSVVARRGTIEVRLDVPNPPPYLRPDMTASVEVLIGEEPRALVVPVSAVHDRLNQPWVFVVKGKELERRQVQLGVSDATHAQVTQGLEAGERVVVDAGGKLEPGQRVRALEAERQ